MVKYKEFKKLVVPIKINKKNMYEKIHFFECKLLKKHIIYIKISIDVKISKNNIIHN